MIRNIKEQFSIYGGSLRLVEYEYGENQYYQVEYYFNKVLQFSLKFNEELGARAYYNSKVEILNEFTLSLFESMIQEEIQKWKTN